MLSTINRPVVTFSYNLDLNGSNYNNFELFSFDMESNEHGVIITFRGSNSNIVRTELVSNDFMRDVGIKAEQFIDEFLIFYKVISSKHGYVFNFDNLLSGMKKRLIFCISTDGVHYICKVVFLDTCLTGYKEEILGLEFTEGFCFGIEIYDLEITNCAMVIREFSRREVFLRGARLDSVENKTLVVNMSTIADLAGTSEQIDGLSVTSADELLLSKGSKIFGEFDFLFGFMACRLKKKFYKVKDLDIIFRLNNFIHCDAEDVYEVFKGVLEFSLKTTDSCSKLYVMPLLDILDLYNSIVYGYDVLLAERRSDVV